MQKGELTIKAPNWAPEVLQRLWHRAQSSPFAGRLVRGTFWSMSGTLTSRALGLLAAILAARIIGKVVYGELGIIQSTVGMFGTLAGFAMSTTASKYVAELRKKDQPRTGRIIALSSLMSWAVSLGLAALLVYLAPWLCKHTLAAPHLTGFLRISAPLLVLSGVNGAQLGVLSGFESFKNIARVSALTGVLNFMLVVGGALFFGLSGIIWGMVLAQGCGCLLNLRTLRREARQHSISVSYASCMAELPVIWRFSVPAVLAEILISAVTWSAATMLVRQPNGYGEMGMFSAANQWFNAVLWLPFMANGVILPMLAERLGAEDRANTRELLKITLKMNAVAVLPMVMIGCMVSPLIMLSYGESFEKAWPTLVAVLITAGVLSIELPIGQLIAASDRMWLGLFANMGWGVVFLGTTPLLLRLKWGALGLASARLIAYSAHAVFLVAYMIIFIATEKKHGTVEDTCNLAPKSAYFGN